MRLKLLCLRSLLVCSVVFSGGGLAAEEGDGSYHVNSWVVEVHGGEESATRLAERHGFIHHGQVAGLENMFEFEHIFSPKRSAVPHIELHSKLTQEEGVGYVAQQVAKRRVKRGYDLPTDPKYSQEWYLRNKGGKGTAAGFDLNVEPVWKMGYDGTGVVVSILDDGIERTNPDLMDNYDPLASYDMNGKDPDPMPRYDYTNENKHGTRCAGEVAAAKNKICAVGVAYNSSIGGIRMLDGSVTDVVEGRSLGHRQDHIDIYSSSWGPNDDGRTLDGPGPLAQRAFQLGVETGRHGLGSIFVWAAGNGGQHGDSCSCDGYVVSPYTIAVGAAAEDGGKPWYAEECSALLVVTPSSGGRNQRQISSCDLRNGCTSAHTGTSAAAPLAAGVIALALQANPALTWRDVQHILVLTSRKEHLQSPSWITNGAGLQFSHRFGFGLLDTAAILNRALTWVTVPKRINCSVTATGLPKSIHNSGLIQFTLPSSCPVTYAEHVIVNTSITVLNKRGDVELTLRSPHHTKSVLLPRRRSDIHSNDINHWPFMTVATWGEDPRGVWSLTISGSATVRAVELLVFGTADTPVAMKRIPRDQCSPQCRSGCSQGGAAEYCDECLHYRVKTSRVCVEECPVGTYAKDAICWPCASACLSCTGEGESSCNSCSPGANMVNGTCITNPPHVDLNEEVSPLAASHAIAPEMSAQQQESTSPSFDPEASQHPLPETTPSIPSPPLDTLHVPLPSSAVTFDSHPSESASELVETTPEGTTSTGRLSPSPSATPPPVVSPTDHPPTEATQPPPQPVICSEGCERCSSPQTCNLCKPGMLSLGGQCVSSCAAGYTAINSQCTSCAVYHCDQCDEAVHRCDVCADGYYLSSYGLCQQCDEGCVRCSGQGACLECSEGAAQCVEIVASDDHMYSTLIGVVVVGACLVILIVTGTLIGAILCKHRFRLGGHNIKKVRYQRVQKEMDSDPDEELVYEH